MTLDLALSTFEVEPDHWELVQQVARRAGLISFEVKASYIKAERVDGMHPLHITRRGIEWFSSQAEALSACGLPEQVWSKTNRAGTVNWGVHFPKAARPMREESSAVDDSPGTVATVTPQRAQGARRAVPAARPEPRDHGVCEVCWQARTASAVCGCSE